ETETADLLRTLAEAHTGQRQPAPPVEALPPVAPAGTAPNEKKATSARPAAADDTADPDRAVPVAPAQATQHTTPADTAAVRRTSTISGSDPADTARNEADRGYAEQAADQPGGTAGGTAGGTDPYRVAGDRPGQTPPEPGRAKVFLLGPPC